MWLNRIRRGFNEIKQEVQQELHNDAVLRDLRQTGEQLKKTTTAIAQDVQKASNALGNSTAEQPGSNAPEKTPAEKIAE
jgi:sec-independent protein translocase protein TatB